ncbi:nucleoside deaminase [Oxynema sp. CENA135]|uniref:nucleoside deaminase n=1 Tax=Oxynema sp. CENA135 TaxID=984206 RepID=UPI00190A763D|nr:nucleoside deaminase [Oxynema sp. CENA135]MBK4731287.1 nucleoside deaminase [Oxynema sp. CENA135]
MNDTYFMQQAIAKALEGIHKGQTPFGACIVRGESEIVSCVHNIVWDSTDITAHAEIHAIRDACRVLDTVDLSGCTIYSTCEPCPMCFSACHWAKLDKIVFGTRIADAKALGFSELSISCEQMKQLGGSAIALHGDFMRAESLEVFKTWQTFNISSSY